VSVPECLLVNLVVDNCRQVVENTTDFGPVTSTTNFGSTACATAGITSALTPCSPTSPGNLSLTCTITNPTCTVLGFSPDPLNPSVSNVLFQLAWTEVIVGTIGTASCTVTQSLTQDIMVQLTTSTITQPLTYTCTLVSNPSCVCRLVYETETGSCHLVCNASFCLEFESITTAKRLVSTSDCPVSACDPFPPVSCPPIS
jgi:hypothetical protein